MQDNPGYVYLIECPDGSMKIGRSKNPTARCKQIASGHPGFSLHITFYTKDMSRLERRLHHYFSYNRLGRSEFFTGLDACDFVHAIDHLLFETTTG